MILALLLVSFLGDTALDAVRQGLGPEMAQLACEEHASYGCEVAEIAKKDPIGIQRTLEDVLVEAQQTCRDDSASEDCFMLRDMDQTAEKVLAKHRLWHT